MKNKSNPFSPLLAVATLGFVSVGAQTFVLTKAALSPSDSKDRLSGSFRAAFNVETSFENVGAFTGGTPLTTPDGDAFNYDDGYVLTDSTGNAMGFTRYWGYTSAGQLPGDGTILMHRFSSAGSTAGADQDGALPGLELKYQRELGRSEKFRWGLAAAHSYMNVNESDSRTSSSGVSRQTDAYSLPALEQGGFVTPPQPPYFQGRDLSQQGNIVIGANPVSSITDTTLASVSSSHEFEAHVIGWQLGPYVEMSLGKNGRASLGGGLSLAHVLSDYRFSESIGVPGVAGRSGSGSESDLLVGGYISGEVSYKVGAAWEVHGGVQFQHVGEYSHRENERAAVLDLGKTVFVTVGVSYSF